MSNQELNLHAVSSLLSDGDDDPTKKDDAALVDSFFLPGGLFSDEGNSSSHQPETNTMRLDQTLGRSHLPQNPWESKISSTRIEPLPIQQMRQETAINDRKEHYNNASNTHFNFGETILEQRRINDSQFQQIPGLIISNTQQNQPETIRNTIAANTTSNDSSRLLRPPPGFLKGSTIIGSDNAANATELKGNGNTLDFLPASGTDSMHQSLFPSSNSNLKQPGMRENQLMGAGVALGPTPTRSKLYDKNHTSRISVQQNGPLPSDENKRTEQTNSNQNISQPNLQSQDKTNNEKSNGYLAHYLKDPIPSQKSPDHGTSQENDANEILHTVSDESKETSRKSKDYTQDDYGDEDEANVVEEDDDEEMEETSIPSSICVSISAESNSSSLSTYSEVDNSEISSQGSGQIQNSNDDDAIEEGIGYDTDQAHVSEIAGTSSVKIPGDEPYEIPAPSVKSKVSVSNTPSTNDKIQETGSDQNSSSFDAEKFAALLQSVVHFCFGCVGHSLSAIRETLSRIKTTKGYKQLSYRLRKLSRDLNYFTNWLMDVREVFSVLLIRLLVFGQKHSRGMIEAITILLSGLSQLLKFSTIEALEEFSGVTSSYVVFRIMPNAWVTIMDFVNLPHWTPHTVAWLAIFALCQQVEEAPLYDTANTSFLSLLKKLIVNLSIVPENTSNEDVLHPPTKSKNQQSLPPRQLHDELARAQDKQLCFLIFKTIKTVLPVLYMVEGFSSEFGTVLSLRGSNRLIAAFVMAVFRKSILSSPIAWVSWALQVLLATVFRSCVLLDILLLSIGLSSIRLIRYLDQQRILEKESREKSK